MKFNLEVFGTLPSTNRYLLEDTAPLQGRAVLALEQTEGVGRRGRSWISPQGSLALSLGIELDPSKKALLPWLPIWLGIGLYDVVFKEVLSESLGLKWPNDLYFGQQKLAGMLSQVRESSGQVRVVLGLGLNLVDSPAEIKDATSLVEAGGRSLAPEAFAQSLLARLEGLSFSDTEQLKLEWEKRAQGLGKMVWFGDALEDRSTWQEAIALGLDATAALRVRLKDGQERLLFSEEVSLRSQREK